MTTKAEQIATIGAQYYKIRNNTITLATIEVTGLLRITIGNIVLTLEETIGLKQWIVDNFETSV
jgi:hypothetical protein